MMMVSAVHEHEANSCGKGSSICSVSTKSQLTVVKKGASMRGSKNTGGVIFQNAIIFHP
jgi:hypothetical protein